jgi:hypothetical protein
MRGSIESDGLSPAIRQLWLARCAVPTRPCIRPSVSDGAVRVIHARVLDARGALGELDIAECSDGEWRKPSDTYLETPEVSDVLGPSHPFVALPAEHRTAVEELLVWLGAASSPRPEDVVARAERISEQTVTGPHHQIVERIVLWLGTRWSTLGPVEWVRFATLRSIRWLPQRGSDAWHAPAGLDLVYRDYLYESQGKFLDLPRRLQTRPGMSDFLRWLGLKDDPNVEQVVEHLRHCAETDAQPNREVYAFLNLQLRNVACLHIEGRWLKPSEVFWTEHPFGHWRVRLGHDLSRYRELFDAYTSSTMIPSGPRT